MIEICVRLSGNGEKVRPTLRYVGSHPAYCVWEGGRPRYTVSPAARKEVLKRLLALNHQRAAEEAGNAPAKGKGRKKASAVGDNPLLITGPLFEKEER